MAATCNAAYSALNRTYDASADVCEVDGNVVNSTLPCHCTTDCQIEVYMAEAGETCDDGTWSDAVTGCTDSSASNYNAAATVDDGSCSFFETCLDFACPNGYTKRDSPETINCTTSTCQQRSTTPGQYGYGTEGWGQGEPKLDLHRCCDYVNQDFTYVDHTKDANGNWVNKASGGSGCLSDKCYAKSQQHGHKVCAWNSGTCLACNYCAVATVTVTDKTTVDHKGKSGRCGCDKDTCLNHFVRRGGATGSNQVCGWSGCEACEFCENEGGDYADCQVSHTYKDTAAKTTVDHKGKSGRCGCDKDTCLNHFVRRGGATGSNQVCGWSGCEACEFCVNEGGDYADCQATSDTRRRLRSKS